MNNLDLKYLRRIVYKMHDNGKLDREGIKSNMVYFLANKKRNEKEMKKK